MLSFHHNGVSDHFDDADKVIEKDMANEWVEKPRPHLPFVPCRVLPRNIVQQERQKLQPDGSLRDYLKPRITTNSSDGDETGHPTKAATS